MKKVLSFVLILALVLSSFSMAFAGTSTELKELSDISGNANEEAIEVNYDLGIVTGNPDGTFQPEKAVTRAEFAAMITRALAIPDSALAAYATSSFKDTTGYTWAVPYLAFTNSKGIMLGDGAGNAMPGKTITVNEAVTMALRAIGYTANSAELTGVWPSNYVTKAQELKLYDDVAKDATGVDKANAAQVIYNVLGVQKVAVNSDGKTEKLWDKTPVVGSSDPAKEAGTPTTLLSSGLNCEGSLGVVGADVDYDDSLINIAKHIGKYGTIYKNDDKEIVAFIAKDCEQIVGRFTANDEFKTTDEEKDYNIKVEDVNFVIKNGTKTDNATSISAIDKTKEYVLSGDISGKTVKEIYSVVAWNVTYADQIEADDIADIKDDQSLLSSDFALDDDDNIDFTQFQLVGVKSLSEIKADNIVYVYADSSSDKNIRRIEVGTQVAEGVVKNFKNAKDDVATKFAIGANTYKNALDVINDLPEDEDRVTADAVSDDVKAFLDGRGYVYKFDNATSANNYAVVEKVASTIDDQAKLMLADGTEKTFTFDLDDPFSTITHASVIGYGLDKSGQVTEVNTNAAVSTNTTLDSISVVKWNDGTTTRSAKIDKDVVVFTYEGTPGTNDSSKDYDVTTIDKVDTTEDIGKVVLLFDDGDGLSVKTKVVAMIVSDEHAKGGDSSYAVFNEVNLSSNDDNDKAWEVVGYIDGKGLKSFTDGDTNIFKNRDGAKETDNPAYVKGVGITANLYKVKVDAKGLITRAELITDQHEGSSEAKDVQVVKNINVTSVDGKRSINNGDYALSSKVIIYQVTDDKEYKNGSIKKGDCVTLYEVDDDEDGYDVVIVARPSDFE
ncbi:S-layer homology domain-containing protein [Aminipila butyrica]|uniref:S-layer homology domain-containing protein n=1 Tax=Aminipila butyrica TaxID=433296 RepID=A0A858BTP3_9FIRM|nr:S-layer homology domain-containing protein [Aminipila butyrica]QIB68144.1 S-layer homology domain-containing protein [Aminipila butyrica]